MEIVKINKRPDFGLAVDGYCHLTTMQGGYKGVDIKTGKILFKKNYPYITNNLAEFLAICHALGYNKKLDLDYPVIYSDSVTAITWVRNCKVNTECDKYKGVLALQDVDKCLRWLSEQKRKTTVLKWKTKEWGEIPADFGHK